jgi:GNAT superfamily N-acetyltransferase
MGRLPAAKRAALRRKVRYRPAGPADLDLLVEHRLAMWRAIGTRSPRSIEDHGPVYRRWIRPLLASGRVEAVVAEVEGRPVGSGALWWMPDHPRPGLNTGVAPYIMSMYTEPEFRGAGMATEIVRRLVVRARKGGALRVILHASDQGRPVYERLGFEATTEMRKWLTPSAAGRRPPSPVKRPGPAGSRR